MMCCNFTAKVLNRLSTCTSLQKSLPILILLPRPIAAYISKSQMHLLGSCSRKLYQKHSTVFLTGNLRGAATDCDFPSGELDTRNYLLSIGVNCQKLTQSRSSIFNKDPSEVQDLVNLLENFGFTRKEVVHMIERIPSLSKLEQSEIQKRLELFGDLGLSPADLVKMKQLVFDTELDVIEGHIRNMQSLLGASPMWICSLMKYKLVVFTARNPDEIRANIVMIKDLLVQHGSADPEKILRQIMRNDYRLFDISEAKIMVTVQFLGEKGICGTDLVYVIKKCANIFQSAPEDLQHRLWSLKRKLSLNDTEVIQFVLRFPRALGMNSKNLEKHIDFFLNRGIPAPYIVENPYVLWVSVDTLEKRYKERRDAGLLATPETIRSSLVSMVISKKEFRRQMDSIEEMQKRSVTGKEVKIKEQ